MKDALIGVLVFVTALAIYFCFDFEREMRKESDWHVAHYGHLLDNYEEAVTALNQANIRIRALRYDLAFEKKSCIRTNHGDRE